ncbi:MAG: carbamoyltransferase HypF [Thermodesulfobacteriota bacterium]|nr:carbamoyltransferase HypF [Thermodesulfobacteriota bacterium]
MSEDDVARRLEVSGIVQGVGFRPFVYQLAKKYHLKGDVANTSSGVSIYLSGPLSDIESFSQDLVQDNPPLSRITKISIFPEAVKNTNGFTIAKSKNTTGRSALISPDVSVCQDCLRELFDPADRRYQYPFINCTNCGPRYTIIDDIPYDRPKTSMKHFIMCKRCQAEYDDPGNRRFHAQPNACEVCGPHVTLYDHTRSEIETENPMKKTAALLKQGYILAIKGLGGYHLAADAENSDAVIRLRKRKHREEKPLALMSADVEHIRRYANVLTEEQALLTSIQRPIVLLRKKQSGASDFKRLADEVAPGNRYFGTMLPYTPLYYLLLSPDVTGLDFTALVMTSGNMSEEPIAIDNDDAFKRLSGIADFFLVHNRDIYLRSDDSIIRRSAGAVRFIRRSRGYIPAPVFLKKKVPPILACGAELKNTICLTKDDKAFLSQHIGDLENLATYEFFQLTIRHMKRILNVNPEMIVCDLHPDYLSTRYAMAQDRVEKVRVQHHHAHLVSCMAENKLVGDVIGLSFDGTGYGTDGAIWGGEILVADEEKFLRKGHMSYVPMPGGAAAIKEPWRMAVSYLHDAFGREFTNLRLPVLDKFDENKITVVAEMIQKKVNSPDTSSLGRLFDSIAAICGIRNTVHFEGQAAMELEMAAGEKTDDIYDYEWTSGDVHRILPGPVIRGIVTDIENGVHTSEISSKFHHTLVRLFTDLCETIRKETQLKRIVLSGGVFQNSLLLSGLLQELTKKGFAVFTHRLVPANDGGISLGQAVIAAAVSGASLRY